LANYRIFAALHGEAKEGWVWMPLDPDLTTDLILIRNPRNGLSIVCERRTADENFRQAYNSTDGTISLPESDSFIVMNGWYRQRLGLLDTRVAVPINVENAMGWWMSYRSFRQHPSPAVRVSITLGAISLVLGVLGFVLGAVSLILR
jgi:hypothetical protein